MMQVTLKLDNEEARVLVKQALVEMIQAQDEALYGLIAEIIEDMALGRAIEEGLLEDDYVGRDEVFAILSGRES